MHLGHDPRPARSALVIGGGIVGLCCALRLRQHGLHTTLIDPLALPTGASYGNAGHIAVEQVEPLASWATIRSAPRRLFAFGGALDVRDPLACAQWMARFVGAASPSRFRAGREALRGLLDRALPAWHVLVGELQRPDLLRTDGHVVLWESERSARVRRDAWMGADIGSASVRDLARDELDEFAGLLRQRPAGGVRFAGTGQVADVSQMLSALRKAYEQAGGESVLARVRAIAVEGGTAVAVLDDGQCLSVDLVLMAAGVASGELMASIGPRPPLIAERGYHVQWRQHDWPEGMPPVVFEDRSMIVTRFDGGLRAAGFVEFSSDARSPADPRKWTALRSHADALGLPTSADADEWFGARPTLPDYLPAIGRSMTASNLLYAFGHQHLGLTLAPITSEIVSALAVGREPAVSLAPFDLQRFRRGTGVMPG